MSFRGEYGMSWEQVSQDTNTSEEVLCAIERVAEGTVEDEESAAYQLWAGGGGRMKS